MEKKTYNEIDELIAYAMGTASPEEAKRIKKQLASNPELREELKEIQAVLNKLSLSGSEAPPSPHLKQKVKQRIQPAPLKRPLPKKNIPKKNVSIPVWKGWFTSPWHIRPLWRNTFVVLMVLLILGNITLWQKVTNLESLNPSSQLGKMVNVVLMAGTENAPSVTGYLIHNQISQQTQLVIENLPPTADGQQYQLWLIQDGQRHSGAVFSSAPNQIHWITVHHYLAFSQFDDFGITLEPYGGSSEPTGHKFVGSYF